MTDHKEFIRTTDNHDIAVLMIHGILSSPAHFRKITDVIPEEWTLHNILLDGHGKGVSDFGKSSMKKWKAQTNAKVQELLSEHKKLLIIAHSMGTLFAIQAALDFPDRVSALFLLSVPSRPHVRLSTMRTILRAVFGKTGDDVSRMLSDTGVTLEKQLWKYIPWAPRFLELLFEIKRVKNLLPKLSVPTQTFQSYTDELVSAKSVKDLEGHPFISNTILYNSGHFDYGEDDTELLRYTLAQTIDKIKKENG